MAHQAVQQLLDAWEAESDSDGEGGKRRHGRSTTKRKRETVESSTTIFENGDAPIDFMSKDAAHSVLTTSGPQMKRRRGEEVGEQVPPTNTTRCGALASSSQKT